MSSMPESMRRCVPKEERQAHGKAGVTTAEAQQKFDDKSERQFHDQIMGFLKVRGVNFIVRSRMDRRTTNAKGTPDFIFAWCGSFVALEAKVGNNTCSPEQTKAIEDIIKDGGIALVVRSLEAVKTLLDGLSN